MLIDSNNKLSHIVYKEYTYESKSRRIVYYVSLTLIVWFLFLFIIKYDEKMKNGRENDSQMIQSVESTALLSTREDL